ncbi:DUF7344 domain-containing protein [Halobacterium wangiae]|uniref:DUF7344 domain-containing protein n=1 Tax=Halobacterium wangiae TaxID=2902623 RepID=UPI001E42BB6C|nr:hypothetical protein [Halobacterium wangiae]
MADGEFNPDKIPKLNRLLKTLAHPHRRGLIQYFETSARADTESVDAVVSHINDRLPSTSPPELEMALHHRHLPKLEEWGWLDYDAREGVIHYHGAKDAAPLLAELAAVFSEE